MEENKKDISEIEQTSKKPVNKLIVPNLKEITRLNKDCVSPFYLEFKNVVKDSKFLTTEMRKEIVAKWAEITPLIKIDTLATQLSRYEQKYYESLPVWSTKNLASKITNQHHQLIEDVYEDSDATIIKKAAVINDLNKTIATVNNINQQAPMAQFIIQTNVNDDEMIREMNVIDVAMEEEREQKENNEENNEQ